jgi:vacuolar iron transporter family protein
LSNRDILLTAIAGAIAGAISMAAGEYIATKTQEEVFSGEVTIERTHIATHRDQELGELRGCFEKIGIVSNEDSSLIEKEEVEDLHRRLYAYYSQRDNAHLLVHMALEFGILEDERRNPLIAGGVAFFWFTCGALPSVLPFAVLERNMVAFAVAGALTVMFLLLVGAVKTWATRGNL